MIITRKTLPRRTFLRGAGTVAIGLPFLDAMRATSVYAAAPEPPVRGLTVFFGEGLPRHLMDDFLGDFSGPLEPMARHRTKLGFVRGLNYVDDHHYGGGTNAFTGTRMQSPDQAGSAEGFLFSESGSRSVSARRGEHGLIDLGGLPEPVQESSELSRHSDPGLGPRRLVAPGSDAIAESA